MAFWPAWAAVVIYILGHMLNPNWLSSVSLTSTKNWPLENCPSEASIVQDSVRTDIWGVELGHVGSYCSSPRPCDLLEHSWLAAVRFSLGADPSTDSVPVLMVWAAAERHPGVVPPLWLLHVGSTQGAERSLKENVMNKSRRRKILFHSVWREWVAEGKRLLNCKLPSLYLQTVECVKNGYEEHAASNLHFYNWDWESCPGLTSSL